MLTLGLGGSNHDFAACLVDDDGVQVAVEEERTSRRKYSVGVNTLRLTGVPYCLDAMAVTEADVDAVVVDDTLLPTAYARFRSRTSVVRHHLAHAASAFLPSPFPRAAILVVDGAGSILEGGVETLTLGVGDGTTITEISKVLGTNYRTDGLSARRVYQAGDSDHSLGYLYKAVSRAVGFTMYSDGDWYLTEDGKTMGLASYGGSRFYPSFREYLTLLPEGRFELHLKDGGLLDLVEHALDHVADDERFARSADLAWAAQTLVEDAMIHAARHLSDVTGLPDLCLAGGVALNCVANGRLMAETPFEHVFVQPAAGDSGCAVGCAYLGHHVLGERPRTDAEGRVDRRAVQRHAYLGRSYADDEIVGALDAVGLPYRRVDAPARVAAEALAEGALVAWFTGGSEFGPRALGHRSLLADPRRADMKDTLNSRVKHRELFRPFAPAILGERVHEYFELATDVSPFMLLAAPVVDDKQAVVPAIVHVDGTARIQTTTREDNGRFHELIERFDEITSVPLVLNTSMNGRGEPIVETPRQAVDFLAGHDVDLLVIEDWVVAHDDEVLGRLTGGYTTVAAENDR